ncbi:hypothetical protein HAX54_013369 [Datura stramonium]|uniref:Phylloplanin n=1 Tax=Datura stramonium TaxID=4076 RepID=A0ABS8TL76_DATST|nr:hypothetical protein [Datura stramonium]
MSSKLPLVCLIILVFITTSRVAHGQLPNLPIRRIAGIQVAGLVVCSATGNLPGPGIPGVKVNISCDGGNTTLVQMVTNTRGFFGGLIGFPSLRPTLRNILLNNNLSPCAAMINLPIAAANCTVLPSSGILQAPIMFTGNFITSTIGLIATTITGLFQII